MVSRRPRRQGVDKVAERLKRLQRVLVECLDISGVSYFALIERNSASLCVCNCTSIAKRHLKSPGVVALLVGKPKLSKPGGAARLVRYRSRILAIAARTHVRHSSTHRKSAAVSCVLRRSNGSIGMRKFFFDFEVGNVLFRDWHGVVLPGDAEASAAAATSLRNLASAYADEGKSFAITSVRIRDNTRQHVGEVCFQRAVSR